MKRPVTDCQYHPASGELRTAKGSLNFSAPPVAPSFRDLSSEFLGTEMKRDYVAEAFCFLILVSMSAWPIVSMVRAFSLLK